MLRRRSILLGVPAIGPLIAKRFRRDFLAFRFLDVQNLPIVGTVGGITLPLYGGEIPLLGQHSTVCFSFDLFLVTTFLSLSAWLARCRSIASARSRHARATWDESCHCLLSSLAVARARGIVFIRSAGCCCEYADSCCAYADSCCACAVTTGRVCSISSPVGSLVI